MPYITDKQYVERLLIPAMMQVIVTILRENLRNETDMFDPVAALLLKAMKETINIIPQSRANKIINRTMRIAKEAMTLISNRVIGAQYLAIAYLMIDLTERNYFIVGQESAFARAWDTMAKVMHLVVEDLANDENTIKAAKELEQCLQSNGLFRAT
ncbi:MAG: hypothetical protein HQL37_08505 [Alphaproteobacteria bacterium]|nr:hypothetical protein [Alphaproteobacteria bacterium]